MAALSITAANVGVADAAADVRIVQVGEAVTQGDPLRVSSNKYYQCNNSAAADANVSAVALTPGAGDEDYVVALFSGTYIVGATVTVGETYVIGDADGEINPIGDLGSGDYVSILGVADTTTTLVFSPKASGTVKP